MLSAVLVTIGLIVWAVAGGDNGSTASTGQAGPGDQPVAGGGSSQSPSPHSGAAPHRGRHARSGGPPRSAPTPTVTVTVTATPKVTVTKTQKPDYRGRPCRKVGGRLTVHTKDKAYAKGAKPVFTVRLSPTKRCWVDPDKLAIEITSGTDHIWSSKDCPGGERRPRRLAPKHPYKSTLTWQRVRSNPAKCGKQTEPARPGWYVVTATLAGERETEAVFRLTR